MLRGWLHTHKKATPVPLLAMALVTGALLWSHHVRASTLDVETFEREFVDQVLMVDKTKFAPMVQTHADGSMTVNSDIGVFEGKWNMVDQTICIYFAEGPKAGETCGQIMRVAEGIYKTSFGERLIVVEPAS